jgi:hypothetical protein
MQSYTKKRLLPDVRKVKIKISFAYEQHDMREYRGIVGKTLHIL